MLTGATTATLSLAASRLLRGVPAGYSANEKVNVAHIGVTGKGTADLKGVSDAGGNVVALCDVDERHVLAAARTYTKAEHHKDFRRMLDAQKDIDAVVVTIPDHQHAVAALAAMRLGEARLLPEAADARHLSARMLRDAARRYKVATQMGNQGHAGDNLRMQIDWIRQGVIGPVHEVHLWTNRPIWPQGQTRPMSNPPVPASLDWDPNWSCSAISPSAAERKSNGILRK
jgi:predicted dehydrogenase